MNIDKVKAEVALRQAAQAAAQGKGNPTWVKRTEHLSQLCEDGTAKTHIAFFGTSVLAKAVDLEVDLHAIKPAHAPGNPRAYSARTLSEQVLVPIAAELGISLGVTGRQPLNNQPYFRMNYLGDDTPVHSGGQAAFEYLKELVGLLGAVKTRAEAMGALTAFVQVRLRFQRTYSLPPGTLTVFPDKLTAAIAEFVAANSEGGRRAQAAVAALFDIYAGPDRVETGRINDPSRKYPGDVCVRAPGETDTWQKAIEVRDKPVKASDVQIFGNKCLTMGVQQAAVAMVAPSQIELDDELADWAMERGLGMQLFAGWEQLVGQALFWSSKPVLAAASEAAARVRQRLIDVEASPRSVDEWDATLSAFAQR
jgi:hypothetical protein